MPSRLMRFMRRAPQAQLSLAWLKAGGWLSAHLTGSVPPAPGKRRIEAAAEATERLGPQRLADEYGEPGGERTPAVVRSSSRAGDLYAWLAHERRPRTIVEFGAAFGVSGMYFTAGLEAAGSGHLYSFEINREWADIAERNISSVSNRFTLTRGAFEDCVTDVLPAPIDIAFVDAIHQYDFVMRQFEILEPRMSSGGIILFDDIDFRKPGARMGEAWRDLASRPDVAAAVEVNGRLGIIELTSALPGVSAALP
jgi:predicted O-methyltransferase YrrM